MRYLKGYILHKLKYKGGFVLKKFMLGVLSLALTFTVASSFASSAQAATRCLEGQGPVVPGQQHCPYVSETATMGKHTGELTGWDYGNYKNDLATLAIAATALSTLLKVPYSTITAVFSTWAGFNAKDIYYIQATYYVPVYGYFRTITIYTDSTYSTIAGTADPYWM